MTTTRAAPAPGQDLVVTTVIANSAAASEPEAARPLAPKPLTGPEISLLVDAYRQVMTRYEEAALRVEQRLHQALREGTIRTLLSSRAKHPDDLQKKLERRSRQGDPRYTFATLDEKLDHVVTDLAGCRVLVYRPSDVDDVESVVFDAFPRRPEVEGSYERHDKPSGYRATHILVELGEEEERSSLRGTICEIQLASLGAHLFNELEHDIGYKDRDLPPTSPERAALENLLHAARLADTSAEQLIEQRALAVKKWTVPLRNEEELKLVLESTVGRALHGDFRRLFRLLNPVVNPLTAAFLESLHPARLLATGSSRARELHLGEVNDVVAIALALCDHFGPEFATVVRSHKGPATMLKRAILEAEKARAS